MHQHQQPLTSIQRILLMLLLPWGLSGQRSNKVALVVAVGNYAPGSNWAPTNAANDVPLMVNALMRQGFDKKNIRVLQDAAATKAGIEKAIQTDLVDKATEGGSAMLYFAGHSQQVQDDNGDETDGLDEAWVPYDSPKDFQAGEYQGENLMRDDRINALLGALNKKLGTGGNLLIATDPNHIGNGIRGQTESMDSLVVMAAPDFIGRLPKPNADPPLESFDLIPTENSANVVVLTAAATGYTAETIDDDGKPVGALTFALAKTLQEATPGMTYFELMNNIRRMMSASAPTQTPGLEGNGNKEVLGGLVAPSSQFAVNSIDAKKRRAKLVGGILQGLVVGSEMAFYPTACRDTTGIAPIAIGKIMAVDWHTAEVSWQNNVSKEKLMGSQAWFRHRDFGNLKVSLSIQVPDKGLSGQIRSQCKSLPFVSIKEKQADLRLFVPEPGLLGLETSTGITLYRDSSAIGLSGLLIDQIRQHAQAQYFREMALDEPALKASIDLIPVKVTRQGGKRVEQSRSKLSEHMDHLGNIRFQTSDCFKIKVTNNGGRAAYFTVLFIQPDDQMITLAPLSTASALADNKALQPGESRECSTFFSTPAPEGVGVLKLITSEEPLELQEVLAGKGKLLRSENGRAWKPMEHFFAETFQNVQDLPRPPTGTAHITTLVFHIANHK